MSLRSTIRVHSHMLVDLSIYIMCQYRGPQANIHGYIFFSMYMGQYSFLCILDMYTISEYTHTDINTCLCRYIHTLIHPYVHIHVHARIFTYAFSVYILMHPLRVHIYVYTCTYTMYTHMHIHTYIYTHMKMSDNVYVHMHVHKRIPIYTYYRMHSAHEQRTDCMAEKCA